MSHRPPLRMDPEMARELGYHGPRGYAGIRSTEVTDAIDDLRAFAREVEVDAAVREGLRRVGLEPGDMKTIAAGIPDWPSWLGFREAGCSVRKRISDAWREAHE